MSFLPLSMLFIVCSAPFSSLQLPAVRDVLLPCLLPAPKAALFQQNLVMVEACLGEGEEGLGRSRVGTAWALCSPQGVLQAKLCVPAVLPAQGMAFQQGHGNRNMASGINP